MVNKKYACEWLSKALHDLEGARLLYEADHYTDTIAYVVHQSLEKTLKAIWAYQNQAIRKTHNLVELYELLPLPINLKENEIFLLSIATTYQTQQRYPVVHKKLPSKEEIKDILDFSEKLFNDVLQRLNIDLLDLLVSER